MPAWLRPKCRYAFTLTAVILALSSGAAAQTGNSSVTITTTVSKAVVLSVLPSPDPGNVKADVVNNGNTVRMTLSGTGDGVIHVPLLVRSNIGFGVSASLESTAAEVTEVSVMSVQATGRSVSPQAVTSVEIPQRFDRRGLDVTSEPGSSALDLSVPVVVLSGPRVSLGGTINSSNNALQISLLVRIKPKSVQPWVAHLTLTGTPQ